MHRRRLRQRDGKQLTLESWYRTHGRHTLPWRATRDRWAVLVSEVMLHQTQVPRVVAVYDSFLREFPTPAATANAGPGAVIAAWGRLGYPRRARRLWEAAVAIDAHGWPDDLVELPGVGRYTAGAVAAQADDADVTAIDVNVRRVVQRVQGRPLTTREAERGMVEVARPLRGRDRLLALMDLGAGVCRSRDPRCAECPLHDACATRGVLAGERRPRQAAYEGSFRQRRGRVMARLRDGGVPTGDVDADALVSLVDDKLAVVERGVARLPRR